MVAEYQPNRVNPQEGKYYYYTTDQVNSTRVVTDDMGNVVYSAAHDPYGGVQQTWVNAFNPGWKFSGHEQDPESSLYYFGARYYDSTLYRFLSPDPGIQQKPGMISLQSWNLYSYCGDNPVVFIDPNGQMRLIFARFQQLLYVYSGSGVLLATFPASNNTGRGKGWPNSEPGSDFVFDKYIPHPFNHAWDGISEQGSFRFLVPGRSGMCLHAGRLGRYDRAGRTGWQHATEGCIRTSDAAMLFIWYLHFVIGDKLESIKVTDEYVEVKPKESSGDITAKEIIDGFNRWYWDQYWTTLGFYQFLEDPFFFEGSFYERSPVL